MSTEYLDTLGHIIKILVCMYAIEYISLKWELRKIFALMDERQAKFHEKLLQRAILNFIVPKSYKDFSVPS